MKKLKLFSLTTVGVAAAGMIAANAGQVNYQPQISPQRQIVPSQIKQQLPIQILQEIKNGSAQLIGSQIAVNQHNNQMITQYTKIYRLPDGKLARLTHTTHSILKAIQNNPVVETSMHSVKMHQWQPMQMHKMHMSQNMNMTQMMHSSIHIPPMQLTFTPLAMMNSMQQAMQQNLAHMMQRNPMMQMPIMPNIHIKLIAPQYNIVRPVRRKPKNMSVMNSYMNMHGPIVGGFVNTRLPNTKIKFLNTVLPGTKIKLKAHIIKEISPVLYQVKEGRYTTYVIIPATAWQFQTITPNMNIQLFGTVKQLPNGRNILVVRRVYHN